MKVKSFDPEDGAEVVTCIDRADLAELCPETFRTFMEVLTKYKLDDQTAFLFLEEEDDALLDEEPIAIAQALQQAWEDLRRDFAAKTSVRGGSHLILHCMYHSEEYEYQLHPLWAFNTGGIKVDEGVFLVEGALVLSPAGIKIQDKLELCIYGPI